MSNCCECFPGCQPNKLGPGCLAEVKECCICYTPIGKTNNCITECGHEFCLRCILLSTQKKNSCPYCRHELFPKEEEEEEEEDEENEEEEDEENEEEERTEEAAWETTHRAPVEEIVERFERFGMTMQDVVSLMMDRYSRTDSKYSPEYILKMDKASHDIVFDADREHVEMLAMSRNDVKV